VANLHTSLGEDGPTLSRQVLIVDSGTGTGTEGEALSLGQGL
jgi:hypothetical protein